MSQKIESALILDDSEPNVFFWDNLLREFDVKKITSYRAGADAIQNCERDQPQIVITGWELGAMPGMIFLQKVLSVPSRKHVPCLFFAKSFSPDDLALIEELDLKYSVTWPFDQEKARSTLKQALDFENFLPRSEKLLRKIESFTLQYQASEALKIFDASLLKPGPGLARAKTLFGEVQFGLGQKELALQNYEEALTLNPQYLPARFALTRYFSLLGVYDKALENAQMVVKKNCQNFFALLNLSSAFIYAGQIDNAKRTLQTITDMDPENRQVDDELGKIALKEGNLALAARILKDTQNGDEIARFYNSLGINFVSKGLYEQGIATYESAVAVLASKAKMHLIKYNLGLALKKKGNLLKSFEAFCESYLADPSFEKAYSNIAVTSKELSSQKTVLDPLLIEKIKSARRQYQSENAAKISKAS